MKHCEIQLVYKIWNKKKQDSYSWENMNQGGVLGKESLCCLNPNISSMTRGMVDLAVAFLVRKEA